MTAMHVPLAFCRCVPALLVSAFLLLQASAAPANIVILPASKDNSLYQGGLNNNSNGAGDFVFTGRTDQGELRRAVLLFDVAGFIPPGSTINSVSLRLYCTRAKVNTSYNTVVHRVLASWGEGTSNAGGQEGSGAAPTNGDATWLYRVYQTTLWTTPGGDFDPAASATLGVAGINSFYTWSGPGLVADVQAWLNTPSSNNGWILAGDETLNRTSKRFNSRTNTTNPPQLTVDYTPPIGLPTGACCLLDNSCTVIDSFSCAVQGGFYQGDDVPCSPDPCPTTTELPAQKDNTLYENVSGTLSNGSGDFFFAGNSSTNLKRRGVLAFDLTSLPPDAVAIQATLTLRTTAGAAPVQNISLYRALANWGEGTSNASSDESGGAPSTLNDATWIHRFYNTQNWSVAGGEFDPTVSATTAIAGDAFYTWSGPGLLADVQAWIQNPSSNFGWVIRGNEGATSTAKRFVSRHYTLNTSYRPELTITWEIPAPDPTGACCMSDGSCDTLTAADCALQGGTYQGDGSACMPHLCPLVLEPFVDALPIPPVATPTSGTIGGVATYDMNIVEFTQKLHRDLPPTRVWGYDSLYPGPTIVASTGNPVTVNWTNDLRDSTGALRTEHYLPVDLCMDGPDSLGTGARVVAHLHGGHVPPESDGYPDSTISPGESETDIYPNNQLSSMIWYHDHAMGITRLNVMMGLAGGYLIRDAAENALNLPSGPYEVPLILQDRSFNPDGSLQYPPAWEEHFFGEFGLVNGKVWPYLDVDRGSYRFRLLNGANSRTFVLRLSNGLDFTVIGTDGGLLESPVVRDSLILTPGERLDVLVDFAGQGPGTEIFLLNSAGAPYPNGDPMNPEILFLMKFVVGAGAGYAWAPPPALRVLEHLDEEDAVQHRDFTLEKMSEPCAGSIWTINGLQFDDLTEFPLLGSTEVWRFINRSGVTHPMHMHLVMFQVLDRTPFTAVGDSITYGLPAPPDSTEAGWKDTVPVYPGEAVRVIARFEDYTGKYPYHCHILEHEDHAMMRQFVVMDTVVAGGPDRPPVREPLLLMPGYPNPMSGSTRVSFRLPAESVALLQIFDVAGRRVATLWNGVARQGWNEVTWNSADETGARVPSGLYFYRLSVAGHPDQTRKLMVVH